MLLRLENRLPLLMSHAWQIALLLLFASGGLFVCVDGIADTVAYWRFEEGAAGTRPTDQDGVIGPPWPILDSSGNGYDMGVLFSWNAPIYTSTVSAATVPQTGASNNRAFDFDFGDGPKEIYASGYDLNSMSFASGWTIEASFRLNTLDEDRGILSKQGNPAAGNSAPPFMTEVRYSGGGTSDIGYIRASGLDGSGDDWSIDSRNETPIVTGLWYHVAVVNNGRASNLYINDGNGYQWHDGIEVNEGGWYDSVADWVIGRGLSNDEPSAWMDGPIDEVRISNRALTPQQFLNSQASDYADLAEYTIDSSQSQLTLSGTVLTVPMGSQTETSMTSNLEGTISAHLSGNTLTFDDLSFLDIMENVDAPFEPSEQFLRDNGINVEDGVDNYGATVQFINLDKIASRDTVLGISRGSADFGGPVMGLELRTIDARLDFTSSLEGNGTASFAGDYGLNKANGNLERMLVGNVETITIPIDVTFGEGDDIVVTFEGQVVAYRTIAVDSADFDEDGDVDGADFLAWQRGFGMTEGATLANGDANNDGAVNDVDLDIWAASYGTLPPIATAALVPEPASLWLAGLIAIAISAIAAFRRMKPEPRYSN